MYSNPLSVPLNLAETNFSFLHIARFSLTPPTKPKNPGCEPSHKAQGFLFYARKRVSSKDTFIYILEAHCHRKMKKEIKTVTGRILTWGIQLRIHGIKWLSMNQHWCQENDWQTCNLNYRVKGLDKVSPPLAT